MGENTYKVADKLCSNQRLCRLLKYQVRDPFSSKYEDLDGLDLLHKQILIMPKAPDEPETCAFIATHFDNFATNTFNPEFKTMTLRFDILCPFDYWLLDDASLRPYLLMQEIDTMFNGAKLAGIGNLQFINASEITLGAVMGGYTLTYRVDEFN